MTYRRMHLSGKDPHCVIRAIKYLLLLPLVFVGSALAGEATIHDFTAPHSSSHLILQDSVRLDYEAWQNTRVYGNHSPGSSHDTYAPDVVSMGPDSFTFFWAEYGHEALDTVYGRSVKLAETQTAIGNRFTVSGHGRTDLGYLHAAQAQSGYLLTFVESGAVGALVGTNGRDTIVIHPDKSQSPYSSIARFEKDTFIVAHRVQTRSVSIHKVLSNGDELSLLQSKDSILIDTDGPGNLIMYNPSVAVDEGGKILVLISRGSYNDDKRLDYRLLDRNFSELDAGEIADGIALNPGYTNYDDAPVKSYAPNKFVSLYWSESGLFLDTMYVDENDKLHHQSIQLASGSGYRSTAMDVSERYLLCAWKGTMNGSGEMVEGIRYRIENGTIQLNSGQFFVFSDAAETVNTLELNAAVDSLGSMAVVWRTDETHILGTIWAQRGIRYPTGSWTGPVASMGELDGDSSMITDLDITRGSGTGSVNRFVRVGPTSGVDGAWSEWIAADQLPELMRATKGTHSFYQMKIDLYRDPIDTIFSPSIKRAAISWNAKPTVTGIDSLLINGSPVSGFTFGQSHTIYSRLDTVDLFLALRDKDDGDRLNGTVSWSSVETFSLTGTDTYHGHVRLLPPYASDSSYTVTINASDDNGWSATPRMFTITTINDIPDIEMKVIADTGAVGDTIEVLETAPLVTVQDYDSLQVIYSVSDRNDPSITADLAVGAQVIHSVDVNTVGNRIIKAQSLGNGTDTISVSAHDVDTGSRKAVRVRVNRPPVIQNLANDTNLYVHGNMMLVVPGRATVCSVGVTDPNEQYWDQLTFRFTTETFDTVVGHRVFSFVPTRQDSILRIIVGDNSNRLDSMSLTLVYPWYSTESHENEELEVMREKLSSDISHIIGSGKIDSVDLPLVNGGLVPLEISDVSFEGDERRWLSLAVPTGTGYIRYQRLPGDNPFQPLSIESLDTVTLKVYLDASNLYGDGIVRDTIIITTSDPVHPFDTIPVNLEHNDLPRLQTVNFAFDHFTPYWEVLGKKKAAGESGYALPPHARLKIRFSEPMDSISALFSVSAYSLRDSLETGHATPIELRHSWEENGTVLRLTPRYVTAGAWAGGKTPPPGAFMPADSVALTLSSDLVDRATTPSGPNALDIDKNFLRDIDSDTLITFGVDSAQFELVGISPKVGEQNVSPETPIILTFSSPIYPGTVDTSKENNSSLRIMTSYISRIDSRRQIVFDSVYIEGNRAVFVPEKRFFHDDSVYCYYQGVSARDSLGYSVDIDRDGIPAHFIDSSSTEDDFFWNFFIADNLSRHTTPSAGQENVSIGTDIVVYFDHPLLPGTIDTLSSGNRSLVVQSKFSGGEQLSFDSVHIDGNAALFSLSQRLSYLDSVHCSFKGLLTQDSTRFSFDPGNENYVSTDSNRDWYFFIEPLEVVSVSPDSASVNASIRNAISIEFSGAVSPRLFDTTLDASVNRSFRFNSTYSGGKSLPVRDIRFSPDSHTVTITPQHTFYSNDSVYCEFLGVSDVFGYKGSRTFLPGDTGTVYASYSWYFKTGNTGFYTYPNPYKPGGDRRHKALGGIWFKNLHALKRGITSVNIRVFNLNTHPVFDARKAGYIIEFEEGSSTRKPEWFWNVCNTRGTPLASGIYLYAVYGPRGHVLLKGKIIVVR